MVGKIIDGRWDIVVLFQLYVPNLLVCPIKREDIARPISTTYYISPQTTLQFISFV